MRCGKLVLPEGFNEVELLWLGADFYQIGDLASAIDCYEGEVEVNQRDNIHTLLLRIIHYNQNNKVNTYIKLFKRSKDTGFKFGDDKLECFAEMKMRLELIYRVIHGY